MMPDGRNKGGRGSREAKEEEGIHKREGVQERGDAKEIDGGGARASAWSRVVGCITRTARSAARVLESIMDLGESLVSVLESIADVAASAARMARRSAEKQVMLVAAIRRRQKTSRKRFRPRATRSGRGRRWQQETPVGGLQQGEPGKGGPPRFFPREGIG